MKFWTDQPTILFNSEYIKEIWVYSSMDRNQKLNAISRMIILLSLIGYVCFNTYIILLYIQYFMLGKYLNFILVYFS